MVLTTLTIVAVLADVADVRTVDARTPPDIQIALAESAAPPVVARDASVYVIDAQGYRLVRTGTNGFTCLISRERPDTLEPECFDAEGSATTVKVRLFTESQRAKGVSEAVIGRETDARYVTGEFLAPRRPGLVYMLSEHNYVFDPGRKAIVHFPGHLMFYAPFATEKEIGSGPGAPFIVAPGTPHALIIVIPAGDHPHE
jgi:hypothetical protein